MATIDFSEVARGYTPEEAQSAAAYCLNCKTAPCVAGCPVGVAIPRFIKAVENGDFSEAASIVAENNTLPAVCGRVCPQENQCEKLCVRGKKGDPVTIGKLERFASEYEKTPRSVRGDSGGVRGDSCHSERSEESEPGVPRHSERSEESKVAVVGSGPAGLACAGELSRLGYDVTIFEAFHKAGGVLIYGIPEFRLPKAVVAKEVAKLTDSGVKLVTNCVIGRSLTIDDLFDDGFKAVFIGSGAGLPTFMNIPGENLNGVYSANEFLTRVNLMKAYDDRARTPVLKARSAVVVGGGNVAMDAARCALRLGAKSAIVYRRGMEEMPARAEEVRHAIAEGIEFLTLTNPREILGDDNFSVSGIVCDAMKLGEPDASGRRRPEKTGETVKIDCDCVIMAIGSSPNPLLKNSKGLTFNKHGCVEADENGQTRRPGVFAGGDAVTGAATVILAMGAGRTAAKQIDRFIRPQ
ncbi:oxidoreductase [Clostridia bacterium]|nr:oxidoreductase [Clostridia bacterium]